MINSLPEYVYSYFIAKHYRPFEMTRLGCNLNNLAINLAIDDAIREQNDQNKLDFHCMNWYFNLFPVRIAGATTCVYAQVHQQRQQFLPGGFCLAIDPQFACTVTPLDHVQRRTSGYNVLFCSYNQTRDINARVFFHGKSWLATKATEL